MALLRGCPCPTVDYIKSKPLREQDRVDKEYLRRAPEFVENWSRRAGRILCNKIASGDVKFFRELADAVEEFSEGTRSIESFRRYIAIGYKLLCAASNEPFTSKGLSDYYKRRNPGDNIDPSTLSKMVKWARSAEPWYEDVVQELGPPRIRRPENLNLKP